MSKVKIYTWADKAPEFLYTQYETIKKFVKDKDWEFIVFNNTPLTATDRRKAVKKACKDLGVKCLDVRFRSFISGAAQICAYGIHWAYHRFFRWEKDTIHVIFDSDMFFISDFNFNEYLGDNDIAAIHQRRGELEYLWNGIVIMRGGQLPDKNNFDYRLGKINGERTDVGGKLYHWLERNPNLKVKYIKHTWHSNVINALPQTIRGGYREEYKFQLIEKSVLHYRAGSNWDKRSKNYVEDKKSYFNRLMDELMNKGGQIADVPELYITLDPPNSDNDPQPVKKKQSKIKIYTWADKAPEFLYRQYETIKKFVKDDNWEFIVFNNVPAPKLDRQRKIKKACKEMKVKCLDVRFRSFVSGASYITGWGIHWAFNRFFRWEKDTIQVVLDSDMFFIKDFNFNEYLGDNTIAAIHQRRDTIDHLWNGFIIMRGAEMPDKNHFDIRLGTVEGVRTDTGGKTYYWLKRNPDVKLKYIMHTGHLDISQSNILPENCRADYNHDYRFQFIEHAILHYRAGSNWEKKPPEFIEAKWAYFNKLLDELLYKDGKISEEKDLYFWEQVKPA